jgi:hypothetical protein
MVKRIIHQEVFFTGVILKFKQETASYPIIHEIIYLGSSLDKVLFCIFIYGNIRN